MPRMVAPAIEEVDRAGGGPGARASDGCDGGGEGDGLAEDAGVGAEVRVVVVSAGSTTWETAGEVLPTLLVSQRRRRR